MTIRHDSQGFLVGEPIDLGSAAEELSAIRKDTSAIRKSLDELLTRAPGTNADRADGTPQMAVRKADFANTRDEDYPETVKPGGRGNVGRGQGSSEVEALLSKFAHAPVRSAVVPSRSGAQTEASAGQASGAPAAAQIVKELKATRLSMRKAVTPTRRDGRGRFVAATPAAEGGHAPSVGERDGLTQGSGGDIAGRIADAVKDAVHGAEDVDPAIKAFQEVAGPISQGFQLLGGLGRGDKQERWYRRIFNVLGGFRKDESVADKKAEKRLKAIEEKPLSEEGGGWWSLILTALVGIVPALLAGLGALLGKIPLIGPTLAKGLSGMARALLPARVAAAAAAGAKPAVSATTAGAKPSRWQRVKDWASGGKGTTAAAGGAGAGPAAGTAAKAGKLAKLGKFAGGAAKRIPVLGSLLALGLGALGSKAVESDATTTRQEKNERQGKNWGGVAGGLTGAVVGQALIPIPVVGAVIGAVVGEWLGSNAGEIIGSKWTAFTDGLSLAWGTVTDVALGTFDWIKGGWDTVATFATGVFTGIGNKAVEVWDSLKTTVGAAWEELTGHAESVFDGIKSQLESIVTAMRSIPVVAAAMDAVEAARQKAISVTTDGIEATANHIQKMNDGGKLLIQDTGNLAKSWWENTKDGAALLGGDIANAATNLVPQGLKDKVEARHERRLAQEGGAIPKPTTSAKKRWGEAKGHIVDAANTAGVDAGVLAKIANFESGFNSDARPIAKDTRKNRIRQFDGRMGISSAHGFGQFLDGTWAGMIRQHGEKYGIKGARALTDAQTQQYRQDKGVQAGMLAEFTKANIEKGRKLGGADDDANVYAFHNLGDGDAPKLLKALSSDPAANVSQVLSRKVIDGNKSLYGDGSITVSQAYERMGDAMRRGEEFAADARLAQKGLAPSQVAQQAPAVTTPSQQVAAASPTSQGKPNFSNVIAGPVAAESATPVAVAIPEPTLTPIPSVSVPASPIAVSLSMPSLPAPPRVPVMEEPAQVQTPLASIPSGGLQNKQGQKWQDVGQDLRERGIAHIVTGGLSSSGVG